MVFKGFVTVPSSKPKYIWPQCAESWLVFPFGQIFLKKNCSSTDSFMISTLSCHFPASTKRAGLEYGTYLSQTSTILRNMINNWWSKPFFSFLLAMRCLISTWLYLYRINAIYLVVEFNEVSPFTINVRAVFSAAGSAGRSACRRGCRRHSTCTPHWASSCTVWPLNWAGRSTTAWLTFNTCFQNNTFESPNCCFCFSK